MDHSPLILLGYNSRQSGCLFRFDNYLAALPGFLDLVRRTWQHGIYGTPMYALMRKLMCLKPALRAVRKAKGDLSNNVIKAKGFLQDVQQLLLHDCCNDLLLCLETVARLVLLKATKMEQSMLQQRAKLQLLKGGDQCTRVFFRRVTAR
ncbi:UNVERIFIED_CONTAM: hypothetical protein Slati_0894300 [Sesamum latifolium]|uniref:Uncharacterized protein n=1 Tax=Sesamum latifolium TaxID=2727402 RepID=A0AAW2XS39_9LAMI